MDPPGPHVSPPDPRESSNPAATDGNLAPETAPVLPSASATPEHCCHDVQTGEQMALGDQAASDHGRQNSGVILLEHLAFMKLVESVCEAISDDSGLSQWSRVMLVKTLSNLSAQESTDVVCEARHLGKVDDMLAFLQDLTFPQRAIDITFFGWLDSVQTPVLSLFTSVAALLDDCS